MSDIRLFRLRKGQVESLPGTSVAVNRSLQVFPEPLDDGGAVTHWGKALLGGRPEICPAPGGAAGP